MTDYTTLSLIALTDAYNTMVETAKPLGLVVPRLKRFKDRGVGLRRCLAMEAQLESHKGSTPKAPKPVTPLGLPEQKPFEEGIPEILKVANRKPLTPEQKEKYEEAKKTANEEASTVDPAITAAIKAGRIPPSILKDPLAQAEFLAVNAAKAAETTARLNGLIKAAKAAKVGGKASTGGTPGRKRLTIPEEGVIKVLLKENPHREGTYRHRIFKLYFNGMTVKGAYKAGMNQGDLMWAVVEGRIEIWVGKTKWIKGV